MLPPKGPGRNPRTVAANKARAEAEKKQAAEQAARSQKKQRRGWRAVAGKVVLAKWSGDDHYHRATVNKVVEISDLEVTFITNAQIPEDERITEIVKHGDVKKMFRLPPRPEFDDNNARMAFQTDNKVVHARDYVLAKTSTSHGAGVWLPAVVLSRTAAGVDEGRFTVKFVHDDRQSDMPRHHVDPMFVGWPMKYDRRGRSFYPNKTAAAEANSKSSETTESNDMPEIPPPVSNVANFYGKDGYQCKKVGTDLDGTDRYRTKITWNNITMMQQTLGEPKKNGVSSMSGQYQADGDFTRGVFEVGGQESPVLVTWKEADEIEFSLSLSGTRSVWWQFKSGTGTYNTLPMPNTLSETLLTHLH